jgi:hypothetical protein
MDGKEIGVQFQAGVEYFVFYKASRPVLGPTWYLGALSQDQGGCGLKVAIHLHQVPRPMTIATPPLSTFLHGMHKDNFNLSRIYFVDRSITAKYNKPRRACLWE